MKKNLFNSFSKNLSKILNAKKVHLKEKFKIMIPEQFLIDHVGENWWNKMIYCDNVTTCHIETIELYHEDIRLVHISGTRWYV